MRPNLKHTARVGKILAIILPSVAPALQEKIITGLVSN
jgi:hypothetical protein